ncbi:hypothetical protein BgramDRAFT_6105 [Paraburkholderia graminis C4D1M]|uniref:Uncharacterized protein n=1 Tax=Paraburkholderia graminis (strain ATCC 700544 / DSM 17151 / LMG 18924 / NCIMB 13744 / C4D1M) TaxID=396598 RepID=B1G9Q9_PARG4|nr:hypothetical protein BgramDRAFT_6105 [Paraburkholderia graminis C4D1M]
MIGKRRASSRGVKSRGQLIGHRLVLNEAVHAGEPQRVFVMVHRVDVATVDARQFRQHQRVTVSVIRGAMSRPHFKFRKLLCDDLPIRLLLAGRRVGIKRAQCEHMKKVKRGLDRQCHHRTEDRVGHRCGVQCVGIAAIEIREHQLDDVINADAAAEIGFDDGLATGGFVEVVVVEREHSARQTSQARDELLLDTNRFMNRVVMTLEHERCVSCRMRVHVLERVAFFDRLPYGIEREIAGEHEVAHFHAGNGRLFKHREVLVDVTSPEIHMTAIQMKQLSVQAAIAELFVQTQRHFGELHGSRDIADTGNQHQRKIAVRETRVVGIAVTQREIDRLQRE